MPKEKSEKDNENSGNNFYHLKFDTYNRKPNIFQVLKHMNKDIKELANIKPG